MPYIVFFPATGAARVFDSYNLAEATYPKLPIINSVDSLLLAHRDFLRADKKCEDTIHDWYERLFEFVDSTGQLTYVDGTVVRSKRDTLHKRPKYHDEDSPTTVAEAFWQLAVKAGDCVTRMPAAASEKKRSRPSGYTIDLVQANVVLMAVAAREQKLPAQVHQLIELLTSKEHDFYLLAEMQKLCISSEFYRKVKTGQDGWRIWRYYTPLLRELGVVK